MQMRHGFAAIRTVVEDEAIAGLFEAQFFGNFCSLEQEMTKRLLIRWGGFRNARDGLLGNDQGVGWSLRGDVFEGDDQVVFINDLGRDFARDDFFKKRFAHNRQLFNR